MYFFKGGGVWEAGFENYGRLLLLPLKKKQNVVDICDTQKSHLEWLKGPQV